MGAPWLKEPRGNPPCTGFMRLALALRVPPPFWGSILIRSALVWGFLRFMTAYLGVGLEIPFTEGLAFSPLRFLWIGGFTVAAVLIDVHVLREGAFLAALGISRRRVATLVLLGCGGCELLLQLVRGLS